MVKSGKSSANQDDLVIPAPQILDSHPIDSRWEALSKSTTDLLIRGTYLLNSNTPTHTFSCTSLAVLNLDSEYYPGHLCTILSQDTQVWPSPIPSLEAGKRTGGEYSRSSADKLLPASQPQCPHLYNKDNRNPCFIEPVSGLQ